MALRWSSKHNSFFLNGDWTIQSGGNYTINGNTFSYTSSDVFKGEKTGDQVQFFTQLTHALEVYLIVQSRNTGVKIIYQLPHSSDEKKKNFNQKNSLNEKISTKQPVSAAVSIKSTDEEFEGILAAESVSSNKKKKNSAGLSMLDDSSLETNKPSWWHRKSQVDSTSKDSSRPRWVNELKHIMNLWRKGLADVKASLKILEDRASRIETNINTMKTNINARLNSIDNTIVAMKATSADNLRRINRINGKHT